MSVHPIVFACVRLLRTARPKQVIKSILRRLLAFFGYTVHATTADPVLARLDQVRGILRFIPDRPEIWHYELSQLTLYAHLRDLLRLHAPDLVVDVGANRGQFADHIRALGYTGPIFSLEPQAAHATALQTRASSQPAVWRVIHGAAGEEPGQLQLNTFADDTFSSFHQPNAAAHARFGTLLTPAAPETVTVRTLDAWLTDAGEPFASARRILFKTDTQGHDLAVLRGASTTLSRSRIVLTEASLVPLYDTSATPDTLAALLVPAGFRPAGAYAVAHDSRNLTALELDCLFVRPAD